MHNQQAETDRYTDAYINTYIIWDVLINFHLMVNPAVLEVHEYSVCNMSKKKKYNMKLI